MDTHKNTGKEQKWGGMAWEGDGWQEKLSSSARPYLALMFVHSSEDTLLLGLSQDTKRRHACTHIHTHAGVHMQQRLDKLSNRREIEYSLLCDSDCFFFLHLVSR